MESIFLSKIQSPTLKQISGRGQALNVDLIFEEIADTEADPPSVTKASFNKYLQENGVCFSARLTDAFLRRFGATLADPQLTRDQFRGTLFDYHFQQTSSFLQTAQPRKMSTIKNKDLDFENSSDEERREIMDELFSLSNSTLSKGFHLTKGTALGDSVLSKSIASHNKSFLTKKSFHDTLNNRQEVDSAHQSFSLSKTGRSRASTYKSKASAKAYGAQDFGAGVAESSFALSKSALSRGSSVYERRIMPVHDWHAFVHGRSVKSRGSMSRWGMDNSFEQSLAYSQSGAGSGVRGRSSTLSKSVRSRMSIVSKSRGTSFNNKSRAGSAYINQSQRRATSKTLRKDSLNKSLISDFNSRLDSISKSRDNSFYKTVLSDFRRDFNQDTINLQHSLIRSSLKRESRRMTGKTDGQTEVDFALTSGSVDAAMRVIQQLNTLNQFLDLLRMRLAIQQDFTLGSLVSQFDQDKKGFVTIDDFRPQTSL